MLNIQDCCYWCRNEEVFNCFTSCTAAKEEAKVTPNLSAPKIFLWISSLTTGSWSSFISWSVWKGAAIWVVEFLRTHNDCSIQLRADRHINRRRTSHHLSQLYSRYADDCCAEDWMTVCPPLLSVDHCIVCTRPARRWDQHKWKLLFISFNKS